MKPRHLLIMLLVVLSSGIFMPGQRAFAGPDPPVLDPPWAGFYGQQQYGIAVGVDFNCPPIYRLDVRPSELSYIAPPDGIPGIEIGRFCLPGANGSGFYVANGDHGDPGESDGTLVEVFYDPEDFLGTRFSRIKTLGNDAYGIHAISRGGNGGHGQNVVGWTGTVAYGGDGGKGGDGGPVLVTAEHGIETESDAAFGIFAESHGGVGGDGGSASTVAYTEGGSGGVGGSGGTVQIVSNYRIETAGASTFGIYGQSLGGAGGNGGEGGSLWGQGGGALGSGPGGIVDVKNTGTIQTTGWNATGIFIQSVGGHAGEAAGAGGIWAWGGNGNSAGDGGLVQVLNEGAIKTIGGGADSISALSVGGGGGRANTSGAAWVWGGTGSAAGMGGSVEITNSGMLRTSGSDAHGISAESIGGGGGTGGITYGGWSYGGQGGSSSNGGSVTIVNSGIITTAGPGSASIFAQSIGGGGGSNDGHGGDSGFGIFVSRGAEGSGGGNGGTVTVTNTSSLETQGADSSGILAHSIGGGGGSGGGAFSAALLINRVDGGDSGLGGQGGQVDVASYDGSILTSGAFSHGIHAMSLGGGGGSGGDVTSFLVGAIVSLSTTRGGIGGGGGNGNIVNLNSTSPITTQGVHSHGLFAESIGGGGGAGGNVSSLVITIGIPGIDLPSFAFDMNLGGSGGNGGNGQPVFVDSQGNISTYEQHSYGIFAQSVGGGGGYGGGSMVDSYAINSYSVSTAIGGAGGGGGSGDAVDVISKADIATEGNFAYGILGQSVGGGGGAGGSSKTALADIGFLSGISPASLIPTMTFGMSIGGTGGDGGRGGRVDITSEGNIVTKGNVAHGILAQSIGGGGGAGGDSANVEIDTGSVSDYAFLLGSLSFNFGLTLGGSGGAGSNGGEVHVVSEDDIITEGDSARGILCQSVGGGGGAAAFTYEDPIGFAPLGTTGVGFTIAGRSLGNGSGGPVHVDSRSDIVTHGEFAHGIEAQSIGGGGGTAGVCDYRGLEIVADMVTLGLNNIFSLGLEGGIDFSGSVGGTGSAGPVYVSQNGNITALGHAAHGILAQSAAGIDAAGTVRVIINGNIVADGLDSDGVHAQSKGNSGCGNITINIESGSVRGGSGASAGVHIDSGADNILTISHGTSVAALSGTAILGSTGNDVVNNYATVTGAVDLGTGNNAFNNYENAIFASGGIVNLADNNTLTNAGSLAPGGSEAVVDTKLTGALVHDTMGILVIEIGGSIPGEYDHLSVTGTATLSGTLDVKLIDLLGGGNVFAPSEGDLFEILSVAGGLGGTAFDDVLLPALTGGLDWSLTYGANDVSLLVTSGAGSATGSDVDESHLLAWQTGFGITSGASMSDGDYDNDGDVDGHDFLRWQIQFGASNGSLDVAVPEPTSFALLLAMILMGLFWPGLKNFNGTMTKY